MDYQIEFLRQLKEALIKEERADRKKDIAEVIRIISEESLYNAALYDFFTLVVNTDYKLTGCYNIPEIHQAYFDKVINPNVYPEKENNFLNIVDFFSEKLNVETFKNDPEFIPFLKSLNYEQSKELLDYSSTQELLKEKKYYDIIIEKSKEDERFINLLPYCELSISDGNYKTILLSDEKGTKLLDTTPENQIIIIEEISKVEEQIQKEKITLETFFSKFKELDISVQEYCLHNKNILSKIIKQLAVSEYQSCFIPPSLESSLVTQGYELISQLSVKEKCNLIFKMNNPEYQKYIIQKINLMKNIFSISGYMELLKKIKDKMFLAECLTNKEILEDLGTYKLVRFIKEMTPEEKKTLTSSQNFKAFYEKLSDYEKKNIITVCGEEVIDRIIEATKESRAITYSDYISFFIETKNHKYFKVIMDTLEERLSKAENDQDYNSILFFTTSLSLLQKEFYELLTEEEFEFFRKACNFKKIDERIAAINIGSIELSNNDLFVDLDTIISRTEQITQSIIDGEPIKNEEEKEEQQEHLVNRRKLILKIDELKKSLEIVKETNERIIKDINYSLLYDVTEEERKVILDHLTLECLLENLASCGIIVDYCTELVDKNPNIFDGVTISDYKTVRHEGDNLDEIALSKLINLYKKLSLKNKEKILNATLLNDEEIKKEILANIEKNPNIYQGSTYRKHLKELLTKEQMKEVLSTLSVVELVSYISEKFIIELEEYEVEIIELRQEELIEYVNVENSYSVLNALKNCPNIKLEDLYRKLTPEILLSKYSESVTFEKKDNIVILKLVKENPKLLLKGKDDDVKKIVSSLKKQELEELIESFNIEDVISLFIKTRNVELEEKIMIEFNKKPYFENTSGKTIEEFLSRLEEQNKKIIFDKIEEQYNELEIPFGIKNKLRKSNLDEKMFLIYGIKEGILDDEKLNFISDLLSKDPFALISLKADLFKNDIFAISKNIISKIYRYQELTESYIEILNSKNEKTQVMLLLLEYMNKTITNSYLYEFKMNCIIKFLYKYEGNSLKQLVNKEINEQELLALEEYIMLNTTEYWLEGQNIYFLNLLSKDTDSFGEYESLRTAKIDEKFANTTDITEIKTCIFEKYFKMTMNQAEIILRKYNTSLDEVAKYIDKKEVIDLFNLIKKIYNSDNIDELQSFYTSAAKHDLDELIILNDEFTKAYNTLITNSIKGYKNGNQTKINVGTEDNPLYIDVIELESNFELIVHSTDAYGSMEMINDNYFDSWNFSERTANHGICTSFISSSNLGTAEVKGKGVMFGFTNLNPKSISLMAPYDIVSYNDDFMSTSRRPPMFTNCKEIANYTRHTHNELVLERRNIKEDSEYPVIQPDCLIIYEEMPKEIKDNTLKAQEDFRKLGIELPIIYINRKKVLEIEARKVEELLNIYDSNPNLELLSEIINKYESNKCGSDFIADVNAEELFNKDRIYNSILKTIEMIKQHEDTLSAKKLIEVIEHENSKFTLIEEAIGGRAHKFDLLDENLQIELNNLRETLVNKESITQSLY